MATVEKVITGQELNPRAAYPDGNRETRRMFPEFKAMTAR